MRLLSVKSGDKPTQRRLLQQKTMFLWKKLWLFGQFSGDKGDYTDVWMIKVMIKANQIDKDFRLFQK